MDALSEALVRLLKHVEQIDQRLTRLEAEAFGVRLQPAEVIPEPPPRVPPPIPMPPAASRSPEMAISEEAGVPHSQEKQHLETRMGLTWVNRIGVITLIIGVAFFFKYAIDNQWIGETGRVILGVLAGLATLGAGDFLWKRGQKIYAQGICGLGISILYLSFYASFAFYHLLPQAASFVCMVMVTLMAGALALRYSAVAIAALGMVGGYSTPLLLSTGQDAPWTFFSYIFLINLSGVTMARVRRWRPLELLAFLATAILSALWFAQWFRTEKQLVATCAALAFFLLFSFVEWPGIFYGMQVLVGLALVAIWPDTLTYLPLSLAIGAAGLAVADRKRWPVAGVFSFAAFWGALAAWRISYYRTDENVAIFLWLTVGFAIYAAWPLFQVLVRRSAASAEHLLVLLFNGAGYFAFSYYLLNSQYHPWMGLLAAAVAGVHLLLGMALWKRVEDTRPVLLTLGIALAFLTLAVPIQFTGFSITISWALEAAALVWISGKINQTRVLFGAIVIYVFVFARLYTFDASWFGGGQPLLFNLRFLTFLIAAASYWLGAWWSRTLRPVAAGAYSAGHMVMFSAFLFEFLDWAGKLGIENRASVFAIGVSILMALYAVMLVGLGVAYRRLLDRILGLGLIALVVVKLYLYDVWEASRLFRTVAFVGLGILLLLTSYLYSRFRPAIEGWWKENKG